MRPLNLVPARRRSPAGFTLIELLVVVSIIALLLAILLPSLSAARRQAKVTVCMANLHAIGIAMVTYADDNRQILPQAELLGNHVYRVRAGMKLDLPGPGGAGTIPGRYPECFGLSYILDQGTHVKLASAEGQPPPNPPTKFTSKARYLGCDSKVWLCPANSAFAAKRAGMPKWGAYGNTYMFSLAMGGSLKSPTSIDRLSRSHNLVQDNSQFTPGLTGYQGRFDRYFLQAAEQVPPHPLIGGKNQANWSYVELHADLRAELHAWKAW